MIISAKMTIMKQPVSNIKTDVNNIVFMILNNTLLSFYLLFIFEKLFLECC